MYDQTESSSPTLIDEVDEGQVPTKTKLPINFKRTLKHEACVMSYKSQSSQEHQKVKLANARSVDLSQTKEDSSDRF